MSRARLIGISSMVLVVVASGACGSPEPSGQASTATTLPKRLNLASTGSTGSTANAAADGAMPAIYPARPTRYVLDSTLPDLGASATVQRMNGHTVGEADVQRFAAALDVAGSPVRTSTGWAVQDNDGALSVDLSGGTVRVSYWRGAPAAIGGSTGSGSPVDDGVATTPTTYRQPAPPVEVPDRADAQKIARALLDRMGVLGSQSWSTAVNDSSGVAVACAVGVPCPTVPPDVSARTVAFSLLVDAKRVNGIEWSVTIGEHRRVESVYGEWASPTPIGSYPLRSTTKAFADLQNGTARYPGPQPMTASAAAEDADVAVDLPATDPSATTVPSAVEVHITGVSLGIARWDEVDQGNAVVDLVPTYEFHARIDGGTPYDIVVLALEPSAVTFVKPTPTPEPMPAPAPAPEPLPAEKNG